MSSTMGWVFTHHLKLSHFFGPFQKSHAENHRSPFNLPPPSEIPCCRVGRQRWVYDLRSARGFGSGASQEKPPNHGKAPVFLWKLMKLMGKPQCLNNSERKKKRTSIYGHWCPHYILEKKKQTKFGYPAIFRRTRLGSGSDDIASWFLPEFDRINVLATWYCRPKFESLSPSSSLCFSTSIHTCASEKSPRAGNSCSTLKNYLNPINLKLFANGGLALLDDVSFSIFATSCCAEKIGKVWRRSRESQSGVACVSCIALSKSEVPQNNYLRSRGLSSCCMNRRS